MKLSVKIWLIVAASLTVLGIIIFVGAVIAMKWDFSTPLETNEYIIEDKYSGISIVSNTAAIDILPSLDGKTKVVCAEFSKAKHLVAINGGCLSIKINDARKWYDNLITIGSPKITMYIPQGEYASLFIKESTGDVDISKDFTFKSIEILASTADVKSGASATEDIKIKLTTGYITLENVKARSADLSVSTGKVNVSGLSCTDNLMLKVSTGKALLNNVTCRSFSTNGDTGDITLSNFIAAENIFITRSTGDVKFDRCDAANLVVKTDTGDVEGTLLSEKIFLVKTDTGKVDVPKSLIGGGCEITTDTGHVKIAIS